MIPPFISEADKQSLKTENVACKVENGVGVITHEGRSFRVSLLSAKSQELSSSLQQEELIKIAQKVAVILIKNQVLQETNYPESPLLNISITKDRIKVNDREAKLREHSEEDYHQIEDYLLSILNKDNPKAASPHALALVPLFKSIGTSPFYHLTIPIPPPTTPFSKEKGPIGKALVPSKTSSSFPFSINLDEVTLRHLLVRIQELKEVEDLRIANMKQESLKDHALTVANKTEKATLYIFCLLYFLSQMKNNFKEEREETLTKVEDVTDQPDVLIEEQTEKQRSFSNLSLPQAQNPQIEAMTDVRALGEQINAKYSAEERNKELDIVLQQKPTLTRLKRKKVSLLQKNRKKKKNKSSSNSSLVPFSKSPPAYFSRYLPYFNKVAPATALIATLAVAYTFFRATGNGIALSLASAAPLPLPLLPLV